MSAMPKPCPAEAPATQPPAVAADPVALTVAPLAPGREPAWDAFVEAHAEGTMFHLSRWREVFARAFGYETHLLAATRGEDIAGVLPLVHVKTPMFGNALISLGFYVYGGILADGAQARAALADAAAALGERLGVDYVELRHREPLLSGWETKAETYATFVADIPAEEDANLKMIPRKKRADVRKGIANDRLTVDADAPLEAFYHCYATSLRNLGTPVQSLRYYRAIKDVFGDRVEISTVSGPDGPVCGLLSFYWRDTVLPYFGGALPEARALHAYDYMYWALMRRAAMRGCTRFDFGRSKTGTGAYDYKTYWGFQPQPLHYQYHLVKAQTLPDVNPNNPKYRAMVQTWQKLPLWLANAAGPFVARQLG